MNKATEKKIKNLLHSIMIIYQSDIEKRTKKLQDKQDKIDSKLIEFEKLLNTLWEEDND